MDYTAGFVAMQVHAADVRRAEERIAIARAAAERADGSDGSGTARGAWLRVPRRRRVGRHAPLFAR
jgi:hypothetical protein